ncbi:MAG: hypothetical protein RAK17_01460 [Caldisphaera sp.]|nr:hypothetical protein [Caldisphaera sp.]
MSRTGIKKTSNIIGFADEGLNDVVDNLDEYMRIKVPMLLKQYNVISAYDENAKVKLSRGKEIWEGYSYRGVIISVRGREAKGMAYVEWYKKAKHFVVTHVNVLLLSNEVSNLMV